ncbi:hypothetical protein C1752_03791 [Acaryochloris thomasi RCC1774]|uniref:DUF1802 family protein n=2 Tax=Acaryochloris TaxID=155977 RepID=A0A2W1JL85_9CYAN|nr:hypothetical protein C1752_03791 [Acaryochloris thomasi RCC1774]
MAVISNALKEWAVVIEALLAGDTILLLRKGGIREARFTVPHIRVLLYPTYEHQRSQLLKPNIAIPQDPTPGQIALSAWAQITDVLQVSELEPLQALMPYHLWTESFAYERFKWKPKQPLSVLLLRVYALAKPINIPYRDAYSGCRSWIELEGEIEVGGAEPVLTQEEYLLRSQQIKTAIQTA